MVTVLLHPYMPGTTTKLLAALGRARDAIFAAARLRGMRGWGGTVAQLEPLFPQAGAVIDSHTPPRRRARPRRSELVARREQAGVRRMLTVGTDGDSCRAALADRRGLPAGATPRSAATRTRRPASTTPTSRSCERSPRTRAAARSARPGSTSTATTAPREDQERAFAAQIELARETGKPLVIHTRAAEDDTLVDARRAQADGLRVILHCFSMPDRLDECLERGYWYLVRRQRDLPAKRRAARGRARRARRAAAGRDRRAVPHAAGGAQGAQPAGERRRTRREVVAEPRGVAYEELEAQVERNAARAVRLVSRPDLPTQPSLRRLRAFGVRPEPRARPELPDRLEHPRRDRARGRARPRATSCSRSAAGSACCREYLAARVAHVHVVELDRSLEPALRDALDPFAERARCTSPTRWRSTCARSTPAPTKVVANLPYGIAAGAILRTIEELPGVDALGRDGAERGRRAARGGARQRAPTASPSVLAQLACEVRVLRPISRSVFHPGAERRLGARRARAAPAPRAARRRCARSCRRAFAHRRKALPRSLALAGAALARRRARPRWRRSASRPTCAPSGSRPSSCARCAEAVAR